MKLDAYDAAGKPVYHFAAGSGLPPGGSRYMSLQRIDDVQTAGWDYTRFHD